MRALSQDLLWYGYWGRKMVTITVVPTPSDATVTLTADGYTQSGNSISVPVGTVLAWSVAKTPTYNTQTGSFVVTGPDTMSVELSSAPTGVLDITPVPSDSVVTLTATGCTQSGNSIEVPLGTTVHCTITPNNNTDLLASTTDIQVVETLQEETLYCNASVTISPTDATTGDPLSDAVSTITYNGNTYSGSTIVPYGAIISYTVSKSGYDTVTQSSVQITQNSTITVPLQQSVVTVSVTPFINNVYSPLATVSLTTNASGVSPVSGAGTQQITVPIGSSVTYTVSQQYYDTETSVVENITTAQNISVYMHAATLGVLLFDDDGTWTVPTTDPMKMAIITNAGNGGSITSVKQVGGTGGGASGNTYVVDITDWEAGDTIGFSFAASNLIITKNGSDYATYPHGGNGVSSAASDMEYGGTDGGDAVAGNGGGAGSGGARIYSVSIPHTTCAGASCHTTYSVSTYRGSIAAGGDGGAQGNTGVNGDGSYEMGTTPSAGGVGGDGVNAATGGAQNGGVYGNTVVAVTTAGSKGMKGTGAINSQSTILSLIQQASLTSAALRNLIEGGGGGTGGVYGSNTSAYDASKKFATPGTGAGGGAWTDGTDGVDGVANINVGDFVSQSGGIGGHGCVIIWRPSDVTFDWGQGQLGE